MPMIEFVLSNTAPLIMNKSVWDDLVFSVAKLKINWK